MASKNSVNKAAELVNAHLEGRSDRSIVISKDAAGYHIMELYDSNGVTRTLSYGNSAKEADCILNGMLIALTLTEGDS